MDVRVVQSRFQVRPGVSAIHAAEHAVDFYRSPDDTMIVGIDHDAGHEGDADRALLSDVHRQFLPLPAAVSRPPDACGPGAGKQHPWIGRIDGQRPDRRQRTGGAEPFPACARIVADEQAGIATRENGLRLGGMGDQRLNAAVERERGAMPGP